MKEKITSKNRKPEAEKNLDTTHEKKNNNKNTRNEGRTVMICYDGALCS